MDISLEAVQTGKADLVTDQAKEKGLHPEPDQYCSKDREAHGPGKGFNEPVGCTGYDHRRPYSTEKAHGCEQ